MAHFVIRACAEPAPAASRSRVRDPQGCAAPGVRRTPAVIAKRKLPASGRVPAAEELKTVPAALRQAGT